MYIGIYISDSFISIGSVNQDDEVVIVKDESIEEGSKFLRPLKLYIEDNHAFIGKPVDYLLAADYNLSYASQLLQHIEDCTATVYTDKSGVAWDAASLISIYLKKAIADIQIYNDQTIDGAVVTTTKPVTPALISSLKNAFKSTNVTLCGVIDLGKAALRGYRIKGNPLKEQFALHFNLEKTQLSLSILRLADDQYNDTIYASSHVDLGEERLVKDLSQFILKRYEAITQIKVKQNGKILNQLEKMSIDLIRNYYKDKNSLVFKTICAFKEGPFLNLLITRVQVNNMVFAFQERLLEAVKTHFDVAKINPNQLDYFLITGTSSLCNSIEKPLQQLCKNEAVAFYNMTQDQIITKGVSLYANSNVEREISLSLLAEANKEIKKTKTEVLDTENNNAPNPQHLLMLIKTMHINAGCDS